METLLWLVTSVHIRFAAPVTSTKGKKAANAALSARLTTNVTRVRQREPIVICLIRHSDCDVKCEAVLHPFTICILALASSLFNIIWLITPGHPLLFTLPV